MYKVQKMMSVRHTWAIFKKSLISCVLKKINIIKDNRKL